MIFADMGASLDGFSAGPHAGPDNALGDGGHRLHQWVFALESWRERQGRAGGETNRDDAIVTETYQRTGAYVMGRRMFDEGEVGWPDPPPFQAPVFVVTHRPRAPWVRQGGTTFTFVPDGVESAVEQARHAADGKDVRVAGGASIVQQAINARLLDEVQVHLAPVLLGDGTRLFDGIRPDVDLDVTRVVESAQTTHLTYRIDK